MSTKQKTEEQRALELLKNKQAEEAFKQKYGEYTLFFHTKLNFDPLDRGKRVTICAILVGEEFHLGYSRSHIADAKVWNKKKGLLISFNRANQAPAVVIPKPDKHVKHTIIEKCKELARQLIITDRNGEVLTEDQIMEKLNKRRKALEREQKLLDDKSVKLIETTVKVHEFFHPKPIEAKEEKTEVEEVNNFSELTT